MIIYPYALVRIYADDSLENVASVLSNKLFGGLPFSGKELAIFDEVPALRLEGDFLGLFVAVHGYPGEYTVTIEPQPKSIRGEHCMQTDISNYVALRIRTIGNWRAEIPKG